MTERRTRSGKVVGSYRPPLDDFTYWPERQGYSGQPHYGEAGFVVVAPSGARMKWVKTEDEARMEVKRRQRAARALDASA
jgi:hypothetical protein